MPPQAPPPSTGADPRPLTTEPTGLDLVNTVWIEQGERRDLLDDLAGLAVWLGAHGLTGQAPSTDATRTALIAAREAIAAHVRQPDSAAAIAGLNGVLAHGVLVRSVTADGSVLGVRVDDPAQLPGWVAVDDYAQLLGRDPSRIRRCANAECVLHFYDTSTAGGRRWCSMAGCGNRAKAARHYARARRSPS